MSPYSPEIRLALLLAFFGFVLWLVSRKVRSASELHKLHLEGRNRLLDRLGDAEAFLAFARTPEGRALLEAPHLDPGPRPGIRLLQMGTFGTVLGSCLHVSGRLWGLSDLQLFANFVLFIGLGLLAAAGATAWVQRRSPRP